MTAVGRNRANTVSLLNNISATGDGNQCAVAGGEYFLIAVALSWSGSVLSLKYEGPDGTTFVAIPNISLSANGRVPVNVPLGANVVATLTGGSPVGVYADLVRAGALLDILSLGPNGGEFPAEVTLTDSKTSAASFVLLPNNDAQGYNAASFQFPSVGSGNTVVFEESSDNVNWIQTLFSFPGSAAVAPQGTLGPATTGSYWVRITKRYFRSRVSIYGSGTVTAFATFKANGAVPLYVSLAPGSQTVGGVYEVPTTSGGLTGSHFVAAATNNATSLKASAGQLYHVSGYNNAAAPRYLKFYNKASAPNPASDTPIFVAAAPANAPFQPINLPVGIVFGTGIAYALVTGIADNDNTAANLSDCTINIGYA